MLKKYSTDSVKEKERFSYWREAVCETYVRLSCESNIRSSFFGNIRLGQLPNLRYSFVSSDNLEVQRRKTDIAGDTEEFFLLSLQLAGRCRMNQSERFAELSPHDFALYDSTKSYQLSFQDRYQQLVLQFPKKDLLSLLPNAELLTAITVKGNTDIGKMVGTTLVQMTRNIDNPNLNLGYCFREALIDTISIGLAGLKENQIQLTNPERSFLTRVQFYIHRHLDDPELDRTQIASVMRVSVRTLSHAFATADTTLSEYIRNARLEKIAGQLSEKRFSRMSISEIAFRWGFNNLQHFSKVFAVKYGLSPRDYRKERLS